MSDQVNQENSAIAMEEKILELQSIIQLFDQKAIYTAAVAGIILAATESNGGILSTLLQLSLLGSVTSSVFAVWTCRGLMPFL